MLRVIHGEEPFQTINTGFSVSKSNEEYHLAYSADGVHYTNWEDAVPAGEELLVTCPPGCVWYKLVGNKSTVTVNG